MMRALLLTLAATGASLTLGGCGFAPLHATSGSAQAAGLNAIDIQLESTTDVTDNQAGFFMVQNLRDRVGNAGETAKYTLSLTPRYRRRRLGITGDDVASRYDLSLSTKYKLIDAVTGETLDRGTVQAVTTFGAPQGPFGIITADDVGTRQAAKEVSDRLVVALAGYFAENPPTVEP